MRRNTSWMIWGVAMAWVMVAAPPSFAAEETADALTGEFVSGARPGGFHILEPWEQPYAWFTPNLKDWSSYRAVRLTLHSPAAGGAKLRLLLASPPEDPTAGSSGYSVDIALDWAGWKTVELPFRAFAQTRTPSGWQTIDSLQFVKPSARTALLVGEVALLSENGDERVLLGRDGLDGAFRNCPVTKADFQVWEVGRVPYARFLPERQDWSSYDWLILRVHSPSDVGAVIRLAFESAGQDAADGDAGGYALDLRLDWNGWKTLEIPLASLRKVGAPVGWQQIEAVQFSRASDGTAPTVGAMLFLDGMKLLSQESADEAAGEWIRMLAGDDPVALGRAVEALVQMGAPAAPALGSHLRSEAEDFAKLMLCEVLARLRGGAVGALPDLFHAVAVEPGMVREEAARAIHWIASDPAAEASSASLLGSGLAAALPRLAAALAAPDPWTRASSCRALARLAPFLTTSQKTSVVEPLVALIGDPECFEYAGFYHQRPATQYHLVRDAALWALEQFGTDVPGTMDALNAHYLQRLVGQMDLDAPGLEGLAALVRAGDAEGGLRLFKERVITRLARTDFEEPWLWGMSLPADQLLTNYHINNNYGDPAKVTRYVGAPGAMDWLVNEPRNPNWGEQNARMTWTGTLLTARFGGFLKDADPTYIRQWLGIWSDFDSNFLHQLVLAEQHYQVFGYKAPENRRAAAGWRWPLHAAYRLEARIRGIAAAARHAPEVLAGELDGYRLVKLLLGASGEIDLLIPWLTDADVWRTGIPGNQLQHSASAVAQAVAAMLDFGSVPRWSNALEVYAEELVPYYPDGTEGEQSFHYNAFFMDFVRSCVELFPAENRLPFVDRLFTMGQYRYRFLSSLVRPQDGLTPGEGMANVALRPEYQDLFQDPLVDRILSITRTQSGAAPAFDSIVFPWSGYHVLRNGWRRNDTHLYLKGGRKGVGHKSASGNAIQLTAFGRTILTRGGRRSYGAGPFPGHNEYQLSSFAYNTVVVDGQSQRNENAPIQRDPIPARWLSSEAFDVAEGRYDSGYVGIEEPIVHLRQVIFVRGWNVFVVTDRIASREERQYSQIWKFDRAYGEDQVHGSNETQTLRTRDPAGPNMNLHHFSATPLRYEQHYGQQQPKVLGWEGCEPHFPAVDIHANWWGKGPQQVIALLRPTPGLEEAQPQIHTIRAEGVDGFALAGADGGRLTYWSAVTGQRLLGEEAGFRISGEALLILDDGIGERRGVALGVDKLEVHGRDLPVPFRDFAFRCAGDRIDELEEIRTPHRFRWEETPAGLVPSYWPVDEDNV